MNAKLKKAWIKALRSGKYKQGREQLEAYGRYCCLGVLCKVAGKQTAGHVNLDDKPSLIKLRNQCRLGKDMPGEIQRTLTTLNDDKGWPFDRIATWIENNVPVTKGKRGAKP